MPTKILITGLLIVFAFLATVAPPTGMPAAAWHVALLGLLMAVLWMTVAMPLAATALLPLAILPMLQVQDFAAVATSYADPILFLFLGAMIVGRSIEQHGLHRRLVVAVTGAVGYGPRALIAGLMLATFFISMWINNTATVAMVLPLAVGLVCALQAKLGANNQATSNFAKAMVLGVAYAALLGGSATLIGTPATAVFAATLSKTYGTTINFVDWMLFATPLGLILLGLGWFLLCSAFFRQSADLSTHLRDYVHEEKARAAKLTRAELLLAVVFAVTVLLWICQGWLRALFPWLSDSSIAIFAAIAVFIFRLGDQQTLRHIPWDVLVLLGGGLALAAAITDSGLGPWLAGQLHGLSQFHLVAVILLLVVAVIALSELASNVAIVAAFLPVIVALAPAFGVSPLLLAVPLTLAATYAFMMPAGTPSNALAFSTGYLEMRDMLRAGLVMNLAASLLITLFTLLLAEQVLG